ncbi:MAG TPA: molybdenum ABC transporter ATP-binding protein [Syntrophorhabdaceae bacterium]|jgi:molybdate transport system ATP-binding protein
MELRVSAQKRMGRFLLEADFVIQGDRIGIFGPSGGGKSTLVSLISGLRHPDHGVIELDGECLFDSAKGIRMTAEHRRISMVFQQPHLFPHLSVRGNLLYGYKRCPPELRKITLESLVEVLNIGPLLHRGVKNLSGGEKQRIAIGRAVLANPRVLLMDEPLSGLDDTLKFQIIPFLKNACEQFRIPYLFISHSLTEMRIMTDRVLHLADGRVTGQTTGEELARNTIGEKGPGYQNLLRLKGIRRMDGLCVYPWGDQELLISGGTEGEEILYELPATDIILFKRHPEAISARNLLKGSVTDLFRAGGRIGVELSFGDKRLVAAVVQEAVEELEIVQGAELYAAIKATAFRQLG